MSWVVSLDVKQCVYLSALYKVHIGSSDLVTMYMVSDSPCSLWDSVSREQPLGRWVLLLLRLPRPKINALSR